METIGGIVFVAFVLWGIYQSRRLHKAERKINQGKIHDILKASEDEVLNANIDDLIASNNKRYSAKSGPKEK